jgi:hypothetical protein
MPRFPQALQPKAGERRENVFKKSFVAYRKDCVTHIVALNFWIIIRGQQGNDKVRATFSARILYKHAGQAGPRHFQARPPVGG